MSEKPWNERIWLQREGMEDMPLDGTTWCEDQINDDDVEYVRADLVAQKDRELEQEKHRVTVMESQRDAATDRHANAERELEKSRQREAQALAVVARVREWAAKEYDPMLPDNPLDLDSILSDAPKVLAVVDIPDDQTTLVLSSDPNERVTVLKEHIGGGHVIVLGRDESEGT